MKATQPSKSANTNLRGPYPLGSIEQLVGCLKHEVSRQLTQEFGSRVPAVLFRRAVDDAEELARSTDFPHLVFPVLAEEKVRTLSTFLSREATPPFLAAA
jgi:hypothetical protein